MKENEKFLVVRDDGYSQYGGPDLPDILSPEDFLRLNVDYLADYPMVKVKELGMGPGTTMTYNTKVGELPMADADEADWKIVRENDRQVFKNIRHLISLGTDPIRLAARRCHELGLKIWIRYELNCFYGPAEKDNYLWVALGGRFAKEHPEYRLKNDPVNAPRGNSTKMNFAFREVRENRLAVIRELAQYDIDGISLDFCVYPPFFDDPKKDGPLMTDFMREARKILDEEGSKRGTKLDLIARLDYNGEIYGLDFRAWIREGLLDFVIPSVTWVHECWDVPNEAFIEACRGTNCRALTCIRPFTRAVNTDPNPEDKKSGITRTMEDLSKESLYAKAYLGLKNGSAGLQIAIGTGGLTDTVKINPKSEYRRDGWRTVYGSLADMNLLARQDKRYEFNENQGLPAVLNPANPRADFTLRIADDPANLQSAVLILHARGLSPCETVTLTVNGTNIVLTEKELNLSIHAYPILDHHEFPNYILFRLNRWWEIGRNTLEIPVSLLREGTNAFSFTYKPNGSKRSAAGDFRFGRLYLDLKIKKNT